MKKALKFVGIGLAGLFILAVVIALIPGGSDKLKETNENLKQTSGQLEQKVQEQTSQDKSWEEKLAQLETNNPNSDQPTIQVFHRLLVKLTAECEQNDQWVADRIVKGQSLLKEKGVKATLQEIGKGFDDAVVALPEKTCEEAFATYLTGKVTGQL